MTLSLTLPTITVEGNGAASTFAYPFEIPTAADAVVIFTDTDGTQTTLMQNQFTLSGLGLPAGGTITYPLSGSPIASGTLLTVQRILPIVQATAVSYDGPAFASLENELDYLTMVAQQLNYMLSRTIQLNAADINPLPQLPPAAVRAGQFLSFDSNGNPIVVSNLSGNVVVSSAMVSFLEATSLSAATRILQYDPSLTGSVPRSLAAKLGDILSVNDFGADSTGAGDSTAAITAAIAAMPTNGSLYFSSGKYTVSGPIAWNKAGSLIGEGRWSTTISTTSTTADILDVTATCTISQIGFNSTAPKTLGAAISFGAGSARSQVVGCAIQNSFNGIVLTAGVVSDYRIIDTHILNFASTGAGIQIMNGDAVLIDQVLIQQGAPPGAGVGIQITNCGDVVISNSQVLASGFNLWINPGAGQGVSSLWATSTFFDSAINGVLMTPSSGGFIARCKFTECWMSGHTLEGIAQSTTGGATIGGIDYTGCHIFGNQSDGAHVFDSGSFDTRFIGCAVAGNTGTGLAFATTHPWCVIGCRIGNSYGFGPNLAGGIDIEAGCDQFTITDNDLTGNSIAGILGAGAGGGVNNIVRNNLGWSVQTASQNSIATGATSVTFPHGLSTTNNIAPPTYLVTLTLLTGLGAAKAIWVSATTTTTITVSCDVAPGILLIFGWQARLVNSGN